MKSICLAIVCLGLTVGTASTFTGCATAQTDVENNAIRYYQTETVYASTVRAMTALANSGKIKLEDAERFESVRISASRMLDQWKKSVAAGEPWDNWAALETLLEELIRIQIESAS